MKMQQQYSTKNIALIKGKTNGRKLLDETYVGD